MRAMPATTHMQRKHYERYLVERYDLHVARAEGNEIMNGTLIPKGTPDGVSVSLINGIPRFVTTEHYTKQFGLQWNTFRSTQLDSHTGIPLTANRFWKNTKWTPEELDGKLILEVGSGAGRFTEILLKTGAQVVSFDLSTAVDANLYNNSHKGDIFCFQGDLYQIPFPDCYFDFVFCYGVLQHTPNPDRAYRSIFQKLKPGGKISIDYYRRYDDHTLQPWYQPKYAWRPITTKLKAEILLKIIKFYIPLWFPIDTAIKLIPKIGPKIAALLRIPCWNYFGTGLSYPQCIEWAIMDTFDALGATYDQPKTREEVLQMIDSPENAVMDLFYGSNGIVANVQKKA